jgi:hypothetical protein
LFRDRFNAVLRLFILENHFAHRKVEHLGITYIAWRIALSCLIGVGIRHDLEESKHLFQHRLFFE